MDNLEPETFNALFLVGALQLSLGPRLLQCLVLI